MRINKITMLLPLFLFSLSGCGTTAENGEIGSDLTNGNEIINQETSEEETVMENLDYEALFSGIERADYAKGLIDANPIITQRFGADPYAMVYGDTVYFYMTADTISRDANGEISENTYGKITTINVVSTKDMVNFTDHGEIKVAGSDGAATWAKNSWAPAAAWKTINGEDKFFLYFADGGGGIGVLQADSPTGPFTDPLGHGLITRNTPTCDTVLWLFDPAVLVDDDGTGYIYFGGGVPEGMASAPGTGRVAKLGEDMISIDGDPVAIDVPYLFEDSGIHKYGNKYYYTYCTNFSVDSEGTSKYGFQSGEIACLVSDSPMGPFTYSERILRNPGAVFGLSGNNHHCVFEFNNQWYITYHTRVLEQNLGVEHGYRCTFVSPFTMGEDGKIGLIIMAKDGRSQLESLNPYEPVNATTCALMAGVATTDSETDGALGEWCLTDITSGGFVKVTGVDFGDKGAAAIAVYACMADGDEEIGKSTVNAINTESVESDNPPVIQIRVDNFRGTVLGYVDLREVLANKETDFTEIYTTLTESVTGTHDLYFVFSGGGVNVLNWEFISAE